MELRNYVLQRKEEMIACLQQNLQISSVQDASLPDAPYGAAVKDALIHALDSAKKLGFKTTNVDNHLGWCEYGSGEEMVAVLGHLDVVPAGDGWTCDPFGGEINEGKIWGRGATDDKGPTIAALYALAALRDSGLPLRRRVRILFGCNEETGSADVKHYLKNGGEIPILGFTPDGEYPVINGEKGIINATYSVSYQQTDELKLLSIRGGTAANVVPAVACAKIACSADIAAKLAKLIAPKIHFTQTEYGLFVESEGISAHGSTPEDGENAIGRLFMALDTLPFSGKLAQAIHFLATHLAMETNGKHAGIALQDDISGALTLNLGTVQADCDTMTIKINYRYPVTFGYQDCAPALNNLFALNGFILESEVHKEKLYVPEDSQLISTLLKVYHQETGKEGKAKSIGGGTYAKMLPNTVAFGPVFPGDEVREHKPDEYIEIDNLVKNAQIIAAAMYEMAK